jgi:hypothetical protein
MAISRDAAFLAWAKSKGLPFKSSMRDWAQSAWHAKGEHDAELVEAKTDRIFDILHCEGSELAKEIRDS